MLLISRPRLKTAEQTLHVNISKSIKFDRNLTNGEKTTIFLATIGMEIRLDVIKNMTYNFGNSVHDEHHDVMLLDENMLILSGFRNSSGLTDGHRLSSFYPTLAHALADSQIFFAFDFHECLHQCAVPLAGKPECEPDFKYRERYTKYCNDLPHTELELCCKMFSTYSRNKTLAAPKLIEIPGIGCDKSFTIMDVPATNLLVIVDLDPECLCHVQDTTVHNVDVPYDRHFCSKTSDYYQTVKKCFASNNAPNNESLESCEDEGMGQSGAGRGCLDFVVVFLYMFNLNTF